MRFRHYSSEAIYSECGHYMITASYTFHGRMRGSQMPQTKAYFHCWFGSQPVTFDSEGLIRSAHLRPLGDMCPDQDLAEAVCERHQQRLREVPAGSTAPRSTRSAPDAQAAEE